MEGLHQIESAKDATSWKLSKAYNEAAIAEAADLPWHYMGNALHCHDFERWQITFTGSHDQMTWLACHGLVGPGLKDQRVEDSVIAILIQ